jgi:gliding motility-associated-like protein
MKIIQLLLAVLFFLPAGGWAQSLVEEPFNYTPDATNDLAVQSGGKWIIKNASGNAVTVTDGSLSYPGAPESSGNKISFDGNTKRYDLSYKGQAGGTLYVSFTFRITALPGSTAGDYFIHFGNGAAGVGSPLYVKASETPGKYNIGLAKRNNLAVTWIEKDLELNVTYYAVFSITYVDGGKNDDVCKLWLDPASGAEPKEDVSVDKGADFNNFKALKTIVIDHSNDANAGLRMELDELNVSTKWINLNKAAVPSAPGTLTAVADGATTIGLSWVDHSDDETGFEIDRSEDGNTFTALTTVAADTVTYADKNLTASTRYYYRVRALGVPGGSEYSNISDAVTTSGLTKPAAPGGLAAAAVSSTAIKLSWVDNADNETGFEIERSADGIAFDSLTSVDTDVVIYTDTGLTASTIFFYRIRATGIAGNSDYTDAADATTAAGVQKLITEPFDYTPNGTLDLPVQSDSIWRADGSGDPVLVTSGSLAYPGLPASSGNKISLSGVSKRYYRTFQGQNSGTLYVSFILKITSLAASDSGDCLIYLGNSSAVIDPVYIRAGTTLGKFNIGMAKRNKLTPHWLDKELDLNTAYYLVFSITPVEGNKNDLCKLWVDPPAGDEPAPDILFSNGADVNAFANVNRILLNHSNVNNAGLTLDLDELRVTTAWLNLAAVVIPAAPAALVATANSATATGLSWADNSDDEIGFEIDRSLNGTDFILLATVDPNTTTYMDKGLTPLTKYYYRVRAKGSGSNSGYSDTADASTSDVIPAVPGPVTATADSSTVITLAWKDNADNETAFEIDRSLNGVDFTLLATVLSNETAYTDKGLTPATTYYYRVRAKGTAGKSVYSDTCDVTTGAAIPLAPGMPAATATSAATIRLDWADHSDNETWFEIERSSDGTAFTLVTTVPPNTTTYTDNDLVASTRYYYRIRSTGVAGSSAYSNTVNATTAVQPQEKIRAGNALTPNGDGKNDRWVISHIHEYPNNTVSVFDRAGRLVFHQRNYSNNWDGTYKGSSLPSGAYIYVIEPGPGIPPVKGIITIIH